MIKLIAILLIGLFINSSFAKTNKQNNIFLNEQQFIKQLRLTHPFFKQQELSQKIQKNNELAQTISDDWQLNFGTSYGYVGTKHNQNINTYDNSNQLSINSGLSQTRYQTGESINFSHTLARLDTNSAIYNNRFGLNYTRPLWRNKNGINSRLPLELAEFSSLENQQSLYDLEQKFLQSQLNYLIDLSLAQEQVIIADSRLNLANSELIFIEKKFNASLVEKIDILTQKDAIFLSKERLLLTQQNLDAIKADLAIVLSLPISQIQSQLNLYKQKVIDKIIDKDFLVNNHYQLQALETRKQSIIRQLASNDNQQQPDLSLNIAVARSANNSDFGNSFLPQDNELNVALNLSFPVKNKQYKVKKQDLLLTFKNIVQNYEIILTKLHGQANALLAQLTKYKQILANNNKRINIAKARAIEESRRYKNGLVELNFVISAQNNEQNARLAYANNSANYQKLYLNYRALSNQIGK